MALLEKKINTAKSLIENNINFLRCPICSSVFVTNNYSLVCASGHTYDISKKGYVNLFSGLTKITKTYDKPLFSARKIVSDSGIYAALCENITKIIQKQDGINTASVLDAGCGGGNVTSDIYSRLVCGSFFALDLSKDGIDSAASNFFANKLLWLVGNLNNMPFQDNKINTVLNILSPANYQEFRRVLAPGGTVIKVLPEAEYLKELRRFIYRENDRNEYSNKDVLENIAQHMNITDITDISYTHTLTGEEIPALFDMTPLTANIGNGEKTRDTIKHEFIEEHMHKNNRFDVTLAFKIVTCVSSTAQS